MSLKSFILKTDCKSKLILTFLQQFYVFFHESKAYIELMVFYLHFQAYFHLESDGIDTYNMVYVMSLGIFIKKRLPLYRFL